MPLPSPWTKRPTTSPNRLSPRTRTKARTALLLLLITLLVAALNELRCMHHGCVALYAGTARGGGATLPADWKIRPGEQLKAKVQADAKTDEAERVEVEAGKDSVPSLNGALVEPMGGNEGGARWSDAGPPLDHDMRAQMAAEEKLYVSGEDMVAAPQKANAPPEGEASPGPAAKAHGSRPKNGTLKAKGKGNSTAAGQKVDVLPASVEQLPSASPAVEAARPIPPPASPSHPQGDAAAGPVSNLGSMSMGMLMGGFRTA